MRLTGGLWPLLAMPLSGLMEWKVVLQGEKSLLTWEYRALGVAARGMGRVAEPVNSVLAEQMGTLVEFLQR